MTVPHFLLVPRILPGTRLISATVAARVVTGCEHPGLRVLSPPIEIEGFDVHVAWHELLGGGVGAGRAAAPDRRSGSRGEHPGNR